jgi:hypothetical protein
VRLHVSVRCRRAGCSWHPPDHGPAQEINMFRCGVVDRIGRIPRPCRSQCGARSGARSTGCRNCGMRGDICGGNAGHSSCRSQPHRNNVFSVRPHRRSRYPQHPGGAGAQPVHAPGSADPVTDQINSWTHEKPQDLVTGQPPFPQSARIARVTSSELAVSEHTAPYWYAGWTSGNRIPRSGCPFGLLCPPGEAHSRQMGFVTAVQPIGAPGCRKSTQRSAIPTRW